nr:NAD(P)-dependent oxidoreductase [Gammaproteobacteria bacterium]
MHIMKIAFIGLGRMGGPMAGHLAAAGHNVTVVEPDIDTLTRWCQTHEGDAAPSAGAAASDAEVVITSLPADEQLQTVAEGPEGILDNLPSGGVWVDHTTASVQISRT